MQKTNWINDFFEYHKTNTVDFELYIESSKLKKLYDTNTIEK